MSGVRSLRWWLASVPCVIHGERAKRKQTKKTNKQTSSTCWSQDSKWSHMLDFHPSWSWSTHSELPRTLSAYFYSSLCLHHLRMFGNKSALRALQRKPPEEPTSSSVSSKEQLKVKCAKERCHPSVFSILSQSQHKTSTPTTGALPQRPLQSAGVNWMSLLSSPSTAGGQGKGSSAYSEPSPSKTTHGPRVLSKEYSQEGSDALILRADNIESW